MDSEAEIVKALELEKLYSSVVERLASVDRGGLASELERCLQFVGLSLELDFSMVVSFDSQMKTMTNPFLWSRNGESFPLEVAPLEDFSWLVRRIYAKQKLSIHSIASIPPDGISLRKVCEKMEIRSFVATGLWDGEQILGFFALASSEDSGDWTATLGDFSARLANIVSAVLRRLQSESATQKRLSALNEIVDSSESRFQYIMESLAEGLVMTDREGRLTYVNPRFCQILGMPGGEFVGRVLHEVFFEFMDSPPLQDVERMQRRYQDRLLGKSEEYELEISRKDDEVICLHIRSAPLRANNGMILGSVGVITDVTEQRHLEEQLRWSQKMEAVGRLAGGVAHDFNNLLTVISGYANVLLKKASDNDPQKKKIQAIKSASEAACSLTQQLLTVSRRQVVQPQVLDLNEVLAESEGIVRGLVGDSIELEIHPNETLPSIKIDPSQLQQVVMNLVINARDAMPEGGTLRIDTYEVEVDEHTRLYSSRIVSGDYVVLNISDTGVGMDDAEQKHLFEPFYTTKPRGSGLGLSTIYGIIQQHGGAVAVYSEKGVGTTFTIYLPVSNEPLLRIERVEDNPARASSERILLVEDENSVRQLISDVLSERGFSIVQAVNGREALDILEKDLLGFDILLTDVVMPVMNGIELVDNVIRDYSELKIIIMSGCTHDDSIPESILSRNLPFLAKPFSPDRLSEKVRTVLDATPSMPAGLVSRISMR